MEKRGKGQSMISLVLLFIAILFGWVLFMVTIVEDDSNLSKIDRSVYKVENSY